MDAARDQAAQNPVQEVLTRRVDRIDLLSRELAHLANQREDINKKIEVIILELTGLMDVS